MLFVNSKLAIECFCYCMFKVFLYLSLSYKYHPTPSPYFFNHPAYLLYQQKKTTQMQIFNKVTTHISKANRGPKKIDQSFSYY